MGLRIASSLGVCGYTPLFWVLWKTAAPGRPHPSVEKLRRHKIPGYWILQPLDTALRTILRITDWLWIFLGRLRHGTDWTRILITGQISVLSELCAFGTLWLCELLVWVWFLVTHPMYGVENKRTVGAIISISVNSTSVTICCKCWELGFPAARADGRSLLGGLRVSWTQN